MRRRAPSLVQLAVERQVMLFDGYPTNVLSKGRGWGTVFWIPALGTSAANFSETLALTAKRLDGIARVIAIDPPGYGASPLPLDGRMPSFEDLSRWLEAFLDAHPGPLIAIGNSSGAVFAALAAALRSRV